MFDSALEDAAVLDEYMRHHRKPKGPLHGLPISTKEFVNIKGTPATSGYISKADSIGEEDALIVKVLRDAGAVFHVKTTNPQGLMVS
jgi:amidase